MDVTQTEQARMAAWAGQEGRWVPGLHFGDCSWWPGEVAECFAGGGGGMYRQW